MRFDWKHTLCDPFTWCVALIVGILVCLVTVALVVLIQPF